MGNTGKPLIDVLNGDESDRRPLWFMRQAGRYLPEYRELRKTAGSFLDLCYNPEMAAEVTLQPVRRFDIDAAILFSDILVIPQALGCDLSFVQNEGPKLSQVSDQNDISALAIDRIKEFLAPVFETVKLVKRELPERVAFIGFCGAPWTVATYMIEGGSSADRLLSKTAAFERLSWFNQLIDLLVEASIEYLAAQVEAGVEVLQIFDSWASDLPPLEREEYCFKPIARIIDGLRAKGVHVPIIGFAKGLGAAQQDFCENVDIQGIGLESTLSPEWIDANLTDKVVVQGNLDPVLLDVGGAGLERSVIDIISKIRKDRHIFNLGHGIRQTTEIDHVTRMISTVREFDAC